MPHSWFSHPILSLRGGVSFGVLALAFCMGVLPVHAQPSDLDERRGIAAQAEAEGATPEAAASLARAVSATLTEDQLVRGSDTGEDDAFGWTVSLLGDRALIGVRFQGTGSPGAAYVFDLIGGVWTETQILRASNAEQGDRFGISVSLSGDRALVGALEEDGPTNGTQFSGAAYVFDLVGGVWTETQILRASNPGFLDNFGTSVSLSGGRALISAPFEDGPSDATQRSGAAYVFDLVGGVWTETQVLRASTPDEFDDFGTSVSLSGDRALVGSLEQDLFGGRPGPGAAYVFDLVGGVWTETQILRASNAEGGDRFGRSVSLSGDRALVGAFEEDGPTNSPLRSGAAYVFDLIGGVWTETQILRASNAEAVDFFGTSVSLSGDLALVGAPSEDGPTNGTRGRGAAYVFGPLPFTASLTGAEGYRMLAHPLGGTVDDLLGSTYTQGFPGSDEPSRSFCSVYAYDETAGDFEGGYTCVGSAADAMPQGAGVFAYLYEDDPAFRPTETEDGLPHTLSVAGTEASPPFSAFTITYTDGATTPAFQEGWNLLGNPLADGFDWDLATRSASLLETIYVYDPNYLGGDFRSWTAAIGGDLTDGVVPAFQGFFAKANTPGATLTIPTGAVVSPAPTIYGRDATEAGLSASVRFELSAVTDEGETPVSAAFVTATEGAALGEDATDAYRLTPGAWPRTVLSTLTDTEAGETVPLVLNALPSDAEGEITVPVSVTAEGHAAGPLDLSVSASGSLPEGWTAVLVDREMGVRTEVAPGMRYRFTAEVTEAAAKVGSLRLGVPVGPFAARTATTTYDSGDRFALVVAPARIVSTEAGGEAFALGAVSPNPTRGTASVTLSLPESGEVTVSVFDAMGREVASVRQVAAAGSHRLGVPVAGLAPGVYVVRVESPSGTATRQMTVVR
ncbi:MAG: T9SS type A sorting domain-containing protein [Bacteroidota bacterium]